MKESFIVYGEWERHFALLSPPQQGELIMALFAYSNRDELPQGDPAVAMAFSFIRSAMDENAAKWERERSARADAGRAGGMAKARNSKQDVAKHSKPSNAKHGVATPDESKQDVANQAVSVSVSVSESVSVSPTEDKGTRAGKPRFTPPTLEEVTAYVSERGSPVDPQKFIDFYASKGWLIGKTPMKDWKAACRNAENWDCWKRQTTASEKSYAKRESFAEIAARLEREDKP